MKGSAPKTEVTRRDPAMVLIAESDDVVRTLYVESILFFTNYRVVEAANGVDALERIRRHRPKVAVLSLGLMDFDAWPAIRALKRDPATREVRLIVVSTHDDARDRQLAEEAHVDELIALPLLPEELIEAVKRSVGILASSSRTQAARKVVQEEPRSRTGRPTTREPPEPEP